MACPHHADVGCIGNRHDVCEDTHAVLHDAIPAGMAEPGFFPGAVFYLAQWFPPMMQARAVSRLYLGPPLGSVVMGALAGALLSLQAKLGLAGWQWLFFTDMVRRGDL